MSIIITGLEMPTERESFNLTIKYNGTVFDMETGMQVAEAHELLPHGRLIDADALMKILSKVIDINASIEQRNEATDQERRCLWWFEQQLGIAPTIIEAEEE